MGGWGERPIGLLEDEVMGGNKNINSKMLSEKPR